MATEKHADQVQVGSADEVQVGGDHYKRQGAYQPWHVIEHWMPNEQFKGYLLGTAIAYLGRVNSPAKGKGGLDDIRKAHHYLTKLIEVEEELMMPKEVQPERAPTADEILQPYDGPIGAYISPDPKAAYAQRIPDTLRGGHVDWAEPFLLAKAELKQLEKYGQFGDAVNMFACVDRVIGLMNEIKRGQS